MNTGFTICGRRIGPDESPLVVAEIGINHEGELDKALRMVEDAARVGACHRRRAASHRREWCAAAVLTGAFFSADLFYRIRIVR